MEQRTAMCAVLPAQALQFRAAHPKTVMDSAYAADKECDEGASSVRPRDGQVTKPLDGGRLIKTDYLPGPSSADISPCGVVADAGKSDHCPIKANFRF